ncbi:MAG TPA: hypothetical protein DHW65_02080 [Dehalococcoidia bacterium]|nr:hypothetical protein [Chloroflexota bacterium]MQF95221.1 response regulator [SAR202 cluster bacterium]HAA95416.1 hypothetical protein [Dehalococcoidia bacterium]HCL25121.1 hypothetical protein [Dehalococcoidia bacterium]
MRHRTRPNAGAVGHRVDQAGLGEEALRKIQSLDYNCILLDLRMSGMGGHELYNKVKSDMPELAERIIFITGDTVNPATREFLSGVPNSVVSKPFDFRELEQVVMAISQRTMDDQETPLDHSGSGTQSRN